jgi:hypothetical protein
MSGVMGAIGGAGTMMDSIIGIGTGFLDRKSTEKQAKEARKGQLAAAEAAARGQAEAAAASAAATRTVAYVAGGVALLLGLIFFFRK